MYKFERLHVYQKAKKFVHAIFDISRAFPPDMRFSLTSQITRAAISVVANIAEGSGRKDKKDA